MLQPTLTTEATASLRRNVSDHFAAGLYSTSTSWVAEVYDKLKPVVDSKVLVDHPPMLQLPENGQSYDIQNSIAFFSAYRNLTYNQAASERFWAYMAHVQYWEYMRRRWPVHTTEESKENYIKEHYFLRNASDRWLIRNGISRLWWYSKLTYEESAEDPFRLTKVLLSQLDVTAGLLERSWGRNRSILHGYLEFLLVNPELMKDDLTNRMRRRYLSKSLTLEGGVTILDVWSKADVQTFLQQRYDLYNARHT